MINALPSGAFGVNVSDAAELSGGGFAAVWRAILADGRDVVVKIGPAAGARLLRYERGLIAAEAAYFRTVRAGAPGVPVPEMLHLGAAWIVTTLLMLAEGPSRGIPVGSERHDHVTGLLREELRDL